MTNSDEAIEESKPSSEDRRIDRLQNSRTRRRSKSAEESPTSSWHRTIDIWPRDTVIKSIITIHRIQGETVHLYATQISDVDKQYRPWQKEQFAVLISRAHYCKDIIFVGSKNDTRNAIISILGRSSKWDLLIDKYISNLDILSHHRVREIDLNFHPFQPLYRELPNAFCGYVYLLSSIADSWQCYVG